MSQVIKTIENVRADTVFDVTEYPVCSLFWPITETSGLVLNELVGNRDCTFAPISNETFTFAGNGVTTAGALGMASTITNTLPNLGAVKDVLFMVVADWNADSQYIQIGSATKSGVKLVRKSGVGTSVLADTTPTVNTLTSVAIDASTQVAALYTERVTPLLYLGESDGAAITSPQNIALTATADINLSESSSMVFSTSTKVYGVAVFSFNAMPSDVLQAISWMNYQWRNGNKVLYPPWANKT